MTSCHAVVSDHLQRAPTQPHSDSCAFYPRDTVGGMKRCCDTSVCPSVPFLDSVPFTRWRYARVATSNAFDREQHVQLLPAGVAYRFTERYLGLCLCNVSWSVCLSHTPVLYQNGCTYRTDFGKCASLASIRCVMRKIGNYVNPVSKKDSSILRSLSQTPDLKKIGHDTSLHRRRV